MPSSIINPQTNETLAPYQFDAAVTISGANLAGGTTAFSPANVGLKAWTFPLFLASGTGAATTAQDLYLAQVNLSTATTFGNIYVNAVAVGTTNPSTTASFAGVYYVNTGSTAALVASTAQIGSATGTTTGFKTYPLTAQFTTAGTGQYYVGVLYGTGTQPQLATPTGATATSTGATIAAGPVATAASYPFVLGGTSLSSLPTTITLSSDALTGALVFWAGLA